MRDRARTKTDRAHAPTGGFALLTVLFGLAVVAVLVAAALGPTLAHVRLLGHGARQGAQAALIAGALEAVGGRAAAQAGDAPTAGATFDLALGAHRVRVVRRGVVGLIAPKAPNGPEAGGSGAALSPCRLLPGGLACGQTPFMSLRAAHLRSGGPQRRVRASVSRASRSRWAATWSARASSVVSTVAS